MIPIRELTILAFAIIVGSAIYAFSFTEAQTQCTGIREVLYGQVLPNKFYTTSKTYVATGFPANPNFVKNYDESQLWIMFNADNTNSISGAVNVVRTNIDGVGQTIWGRIIPVANKIDTFTGMTIRTIPAGNHTIGIDFRVSTGNGTLSTQALGMHIYEVCLNE